MGEQTTPHNTCAQNFEQTLAWATPMPEAIITYIQIQNITGVLRIPRSHHVEWNPILKYSI